MVTLPTGNDDLNLLILTPSNEPAQTILYCFSLSQKYFNEAIALSLTWISSRNKIVLSGLITIFLIILSNYIILFQYLYYY